MSSRVPDSIEGTGFYAPMDIAPGEYIKCPECKGKRIASSNTPGIRDGHACFRCNATGTVLASEPTAPPQTSELPKEEAV